MLKSIIAAALLLGGAASPAAQPSDPAAAPGAVLVERDTPIRLMVLKEVSSRTAKPGDRFVLRVDEAVVIDGATVIPVGARAWGEISSASKSGNVSKGGDLAARLLYVEVGEDRIPLAGESRTATEVDSTKTALSVLALGPLALLAPTNNAKLKAGHIFNAYLAEDVVFDPATRRLVAADVAKAGVATP